MDQGKQGLSSPVGRTPYLLKEMLPALQGQSRRWDNVCIWFPSIVPISRSCGLISEQVGWDLTHSCWAQHIASWHRRTPRRKWCNRTYHHSSYTHIPSLRRLSVLDQSQYPIVINTSSWTVCTLSASPVVPGATCYCDGVGSLIVGQCSGLGSSKSGNSAATPPNSSSLVNDWIVFALSSLLSLTYSLYTPACMYTTYFCLWFHWSPIVCHHHQIYLYNKLFSVG